MGDQGKRIEARNCTGRSKLKVWGKTRLQASDDWLYSYIESDFTHNYAASQEINVKRIRSHCLVAIFFFCHIDLHSGYAFSSDCTKIVSQKLSLTVCLRNARTTYFFFRNDYLQPLQEGLKEEKEKKNPKQPEEKAIPSGPWTSKLRHIDISATSSRRIDVSTTLLWRPTFAGMLLKKSKPNRTWRPINVDATWFTSHRCRYNVILPF